MTKIVIGLAPTRRSIFSAPDAVKFADLTRKRLRELSVEFVDIDDIAEDGLLHSEEDRIKIAENSKRRRWTVSSSPTETSGRSMRWPDWRRS